MDTRKTTLTKHDVLKYIIDHPSCTPSEIFHTLGLNTGTTRYHIQMLMREGKIIGFREGKYLRLFHISNDYWHIADMIGPCLGNADYKRILGCIMNEPGITAVEIIRKTNISKAAIGQLVEYLHDKHIISKMRDGKRIKLFLTADAEKILRGLDL